MAETRCGKAEIQKLDQVTLGFGLIDARCGSHPAGSLREFGSLLSCGLWVVGCIDETPLPHALAR